MKKRNILYRYWQGETLLYVGRTDDPFRRNLSHEQKSEWWPLADKVTFEHFATLDELMWAEERAIKRECPSYNVQHNTLNPKRVKPVPMSTVPTPEEDDEDFMDRMRAAVDSLPLGYRPKVAA